MALARLTSAAAADLLAAHDWYEERASGLGQDFVRAVDASLALAVRQPELSPPMHRGLRRLLTRRFPYAIYYQIDGETLRVIAILHTAMSLKRLEERR
jgi:toxin ParE1/3/4